jgi:hypothetical protein
LKTSSTLRHASGKVQQDGLETRVLLIAAERLRSRRAVGDLLTVNLRTDIGRSSSTSECLESLGFISFLREIRNIRRESSQLCHEQQENASFLYGDGRL